MTCPDCKIVFNMPWTPGSPREVILLCPKHAGVDALLSAADDALAALVNEDVLVPGKYQAARELLRAAIIACERKA